MVLHDGMRAYLPECGFVFIDRVYRANCKYGSAVDLHVTQHGGHRKRYIGALRMSARGTQGPQGGATR